MIRFVRLLVVLALSAPAARGGVTDPAELFPADTLAYAEVARPGELAEAVAGMLRAGRLADPVRATHDRLDKAASPQAAVEVRQAAWVGLLAAPEFAAEAKRLGGVAVGVTGFNERHEPRVAVAVLLGDSAAAGLAARAFLTTTPDVRRVGAVDGVPVFRHRNFVGRPIGPDGNPVPEEKEEARATPEPAEGPAEPTYAHVPGLFVIGSDQTAVADVLHRFAGKGSTPTLAGAEAFRKCRSARGRSGVFFYATPPALAAKTARAGGPGTDGEVRALLRFAAGPKGVKVVAGNLTLGPNAVAVSAEAELDPAAAGPLADVLAGAAVARDDFRSAAGRPGWAVTLALPAADRRAKAVLGLLDAVAKANGVLGRKPSEVIAEADRGPGPKVAGELLRGVKAVTVFAPAKPELPAGGRPLPMLVLHTETDADAEKWEQAAAKLVALLAGGGGPLTTPSSEVVGGVRVASLAGAGMLGNAPVHWARSGGAIGFGQDRKLLAQAVTGKGPPPAWPAEFAADGSPALLAVVTPARLVAHLIPPPPKNGKPAEEKKGDFLAPPAAFSPFQPGVVQAPQPPEPLAVGLARAAEGLPPVYAAVGRSGNVVRFELRMPDARKPVADAADRFVGWLEKQSAPAAGTVIPYPLWAK